MFPQCRHKHRWEAVFEPRDFIAYVKKRAGCGRTAVPKNAIFCYTQAIPDYAQKTRVTAEHDFLKRLCGSVSVINNVSPSVALVKAGIGAPAAASLFDEMIAAGVRNFVNIGMAGTLQKNLRPGDIILCEKAIRDEGVSHHYLTNSKYAYPSPALTKKLASAFVRLGIPFSQGISWTIDAPYRETKEEVLRYQKAGVSTVEMEASALFAVAARRKVNVAAAFVVSDSLAELEWNPDFHDERLWGGLKKLFDAAVLALSDGGKR